jgi:hypothetical protein
VQNVHPEQQGACDACMLQETRRSGKVCSRAIVAAAHDDPCVFAYFVQGCIACCCVATLLGTLLPLLFFVKQLGIF